MITSIFIKNFVLIDELNIDFENSFSALCGETGAGKSVILKAIDSVTGGKCGKELIKYGKDKALIEATFQGINDIKIEMNGEEDVLDSEVVISREITPTNSKFRVNGALVNLEYVKKIGEKLLDIHTQHQTYAYLQKKYHIKFLDDYISLFDKDFSSSLNEYSTLFLDFINTKNKIEEIEKNNSDIERKIDFLKFQINEIDSINLENGEEENLREELEILSNVLELKETAYKSYWALSGDDNSILDGLSNIEGLLSGISNKDKNLSNYMNEFYEGYENLKVFANDLRNYSENLKDNPERLDEINERLSLIEKLKRKYGDDLFLALENFQNELNSLTFGVDELENLKSKVVEIENKCKDLSDFISKKRKLNAEELSKNITQNLYNLELLNAKFEVRVSEKEMSADGIDDVEFLMSANTDTPMSPIQKTASGGELSRIMLAIKSVFSELNNTQTLILDEIDTGISGKTSQAVSQVISKLSEKTQIIAITHQPIIASKAKNIYWVKKENTDTSTNVSVQKININNAQNVLAQMASGNLSDASLEFAKNLISG